MLVVFANVPEIAATPDDCDKPPVKPVPVGADHVNVVPAGMMPLVTSVGVMINGTPLQVVVDNGLTVALGFSDITTENAAPVQLPETGVTV